MLSITGGGVFLTQIEGGGRGKGDRHNKSWFTRGSNKTPKSRSARRPNRLLPDQPRGTTATESNSKNDTPIVKEKVAPKGWKKHFQEWLEAANNWVRGVVKSKRVQSVIGPILKFGLLKLFFTLYTGFLGGNLLIGNVDTFMSHSKGLLRALLAIFTYNKGVELAFKPTVKIEGVKSFLLRFLQVISRVIAAGFRFVEYNTTKNNKLIEYSKVTGRNRLVTAYYIVVWEADREDDKMSFKTWWDSRKTKNLDDIGQ